MNELTTRLDEITAEAIVLYQRMEKDYRRWGELMLEAKKLVPYGKWLDYLETNFPAFSQRQAYRYMELARDETGELTASQISNKSRNMHLTSTSNLEREVRAIERKNEEIIAQNSFVPGLLAWLERLDLNEPTPYELAQIREACERLINRINAKGERKWPHLVVGK